MTGRLALLLAASSGLAGHASGQSLQQAIDTMLMNNCRGASGAGGYSGGLFSEEEILEVEAEPVFLRDSNHRLDVTATDNFVYFGDDFPEGTALSAPEIWFDPEKEDGLRIGGYLDVEIDEETGLPSGLDFTIPDSGPGQLFQFVPVTDEENDANRTVVLVDGVSYSVAAPLVPMNNGNVTTANVNFFNIDLSLDRTYQVRTDIVASSEGLGDPLLSICGTIGAPGEETVRYSVSTGFEFNIDGPNTTDLPGLLPSAGGGLTPAGSASGLGPQANQNRDLTIRRDRSLLAQVRRLFARDQRDRERERRRDALARPIILASRDGAFAYPNGVDTAPRNYNFVADVSGGAVNIDRRETPLEGAFTADSLSINASAGVIFHGGDINGSSLLIGAGISHEETETEGEAPRATSGGTSSLTSSADTEAQSASAFISWTSAAFAQEPGKDSRFAVTLSYTNGTAEQDYQRDFATTFLPDASMENQVIAETFRDSVEHEFESISLHASMTRVTGNWTLTPHIAANHVTFSTNPHAEETSAGLGALALDYQGVDDEWTELRAGFALGYRSEIDRTSAAIRWSVGVDAIFVEDAETPERTAFFLQDQRAQRAPIVYQVDDLDSEYFDLNFGVALETGTAFEPYATVFTRTGHEFLDMNGAVIGLRATF